MATTLHHERDGTAALPRSQADDAGFGLAAVARLAVACSRFVADHYRWLLLMIPLYAISAHGMSAWPFAVALATAVVTYGTTLSIAERRWPDWVAERALYLRCTEIGLICIGLSLLYLRSENLEGQFYYDGFYAME
jgi:hypothetical protein